MALYSITLSEIKAQIILSIAHLLTNKKTVNIYLDDPSFSDIFKTDKKIHRVDKCFKADLIITKNSKNIKRMCQNKRANIISTRYKDYKQNSDIDFGAFFWQKGRPNMLINSKIIQKRRIRLPRSYLKYLD
jgi:hypothetical protein